MCCIYCHTTLEIDDYPYGCPYCAKKGIAASVTFEYSKNFKIDSSAKGYARYQQTLPYNVSEICYLGDGNTPLVNLENLASQLGIMELYSKNEFQNPSGSHKDRMSNLFVTRGKNSDNKVLVAASSGNAGVSLALYSAKKNLKCTIVSTNAIDNLWRKSIEATGAQLVYTETYEQRWDYIKKGVDAGKFLSATNFINPPIGSNPFGVQGYKTIAYELFEDLDENMVDYILVPTGRGDLIWGIYEGLLDLKQSKYIKELPKLVAVEPFERLSRVKVLKDLTKYYKGDYSKTPSIGGETVTIQAYLAIKKTKGFSVSVSQNKVMDSINTLAQQGLYLEESSAISISCLEKLINSGAIPNSSRVALISTSHGYKNII